jgi:hypothetical protein
VGVDSTIEKKSVQIIDPLKREVTSEYLIDRANSTAYIEVANSSGLPMLKKEERNPTLSSSIVGILSDMIKSYRELAKLCGNALRSRMFEELFWVQGAQPTSMGALVHSGKGWVSLMRLKLTEAYWISRVTIPT